MGLTEEMKALDDALRKAGYVVQADWLQFCMYNSEKHKIAIVGDYTTGKSTLINSLLGKKVIKTSVIPTENKIVITKGESDTIILENDERVPLDRFDSILEDDSDIRIEIASEQLNNLEIIEFPGFINKKILNNIQAMGELYLCDAVILVMGANHLLSETESFFLDNLSSYIGEDKIYVVINKLDLISETDIARIVDFAKKQMAQKHPDIKWCFLHEELLTDYSDLTVGINAVKEFVEIICKREKNSINETAFREIKKELSMFVALEEKRIRELNEKEKTEEEEDKIKKEQQRSIEKTRLENALLEFRGKKNKTIAQIDEYIDKIFKEMGASIVLKFDEASDKYIWYKEKFPVVWSDEVRKASRKTDQYILECIEDDITWLNSVSQVKSEMNGVCSAIEIEGIHNTYTGKKYGTVKKYLPIGIGGGVVIGFCLFRIVGASICLGGGVLFNLYLNYLDQQQNSELASSIQEDMNKISRSSRTITKGEILKIYERVEFEFSSNIEKYLHQKYQVDMDKIDYSSMLLNISEIMVLLQY